MIVEISELLESVLGQYHRQHDLRQVPILIEHLKPMMQERGFADRLVLEKYDFPVRNIAAQVSFFEAEMGTYAGNGIYARIQYSKSLNFCWERFVVCKEMYHSILDKYPSERVADIGHLMKLAERLVSDAAAQLEPYSPHSTEINAEILALETLFPLELRSYYKRDYELGKVTDHQLALRYRIPEQYARMGMYPDYTSVIQRVRKGRLINVAT